MRHQEYWRRRVIKYQIIAVSHSYMYVRMCALYSKLYFTLYAILYVSAAWISNRLICY